MKKRKSVEWTKLDNASKIFPATCNNLDTKVFRLVCELVEPVEPELLQQALNETLESFPFYKSVLRRGVFWYYFETSDLHALVEIESKPLCAPIYNKDKKNLLFRVSYYNHRINLEIFHALSDGTGALWFMQTLIFHYLLLTHKEIIVDKTLKLNYNASISEKMNDSFGRHFVGDVPVHKTNNLVKTPRAYRIRGTKLEENRMNLVEGSLSVKAVLEEAHKYNTTLTIFITSLFIYSIYKNMHAHGKKRPVVLSVPINLRNFYESETARNFFSTFHVTYDFRKGKTKLQEVIQAVSDAFPTELTEERLDTHLNHLMSLEKNPFARIIPLPMKDAFIRIGNKAKDRGISAAISNIGRILMPSQFDPYIRQFCISTSARRPQICFCSYGDRLVVSFTTPYRETEIQRTFFKHLTKDGIEVEVSSNLLEKREVE